MAPVIRLNLAGIQTDQRVARDGGEGVGMGRGCIAFGAAAALSAMAAIGPAQADPRSLVLDPARPAEGAGALSQALSDQAETVSVRFEEELTPETFFDTAAAPWFERVAATPGRSALTCVFPLRRGLVDSDQMRQNSAEGGRVAGGAFDRTAAAARYDAYLMVGETRSGRQRVVRLIFARADAPLGDCGAAFDFMRLTS